PFLVATSVQLICAQRLIRRICKACKQEVKPPPEAAMLELGFTEAEIANPKIFKGAGCRACNDTGYKGRVGLFVVMEITPQLKVGIIGNGTSVELKKIAIAGGMITLRRSGLLKVQEGLTTIEEVVRESMH